MLHIFYGRLDEVGEKAKVQDKEWKFFNYLAPSLAFPALVLSSLSLAESEIGSFEKRFLPKLGSSTVVAKSQDIRQSLKLDDLMQGKSSDFFSSLNASTTEYLFLINKDKQTAGVYKITVEKVDETSVSTGKVPGEKAIEGDKKTPSGFYEVVSVEKSSGWLHNGSSGEYGNYFSRLNTGAWDKKGEFFPAAKSSIGLHGTSYPELLGTRASEGCIRFENGKNDFYVKSGMLKEGTMVSILDDSKKF